MESSNMMISLLYKQNLSMGRQMVKGSNTLVLDGIMWEILLIIIFKEEVNMFHLKFPTVDSLETILFMGKDN